MIIHAFLLIQICQSQCISALEVSKRYWQAMKIKTRTDKKHTLCLLSLSTTAASSPQMQWEASITSASSSHDLSFTRPLLSDLAVGSMFPSSFCRATASLRSFTSLSFNRRSCFSRCSVTSLSQFFARDWAIVDACLNRASTPSASPSAFYDNNHPMTNYTCSRLTYYPKPTTIARIRNNCTMTLRSTTSPLNSTADIQSRDHNEAVISFALVIIIVINITVQ